MNYNAIQLKTGGQLSAQRGDVPVINGLGLCQARNGVGSIAAVKGGTLAVNSRDLS